MRSSVKRRTAAVTAAAVGAAALLAGPGSSLAISVSQTAQSLAQGSAAPAAPAQATPARPAPAAPRTVTPTRHATVRHLTATRTAAASPPVDVSVQGTNPHGQGTVLSLSLAGKEAVVVGRSRGEQRSDGSYHGHTTTLGLFGNDVIGNDTTSGQTAKGPIAPVQEQVLDQICKASTGNLCVDLLRADSATTTTGSTNHSRLAGLIIGGNSGVVADAGDSNGNIQSNGDCQTAHGDTTLLKLMLGGNPLVDLGESATDSNACPGATTVTNSSNPLLAIGGQPIPLPGCGANAPGNLIDASPLLTIACNAGAQTGAGSALNDALAGTVIAAGSAPVGAVSGAGTGAAAQPGTTAPAQPSPSQAVAGTRQTGPGTGKTKSNKGSGPSSSTGKGGGATSDNGSGGGSGTPKSTLAARSLAANKTGGKLPYTGTDIVLALFMASLLLAGGLGIRSLTRIREAQ